MCVKKYAIGYQIQKMKDFKREFDRIWNLISSNENFVLARYADGEVGVMKGHQVNGSDKWTSPSGKTKLGEDLIKTLYHTEPNYFYGISCECCDEESKKFLLGHIKQAKEYITYSNIFVNANYILFIENLKKLNKPITILGNIEGESKKYPFPVDSYVSFGDDCVEVWEEHRDEIRQLLSRNFKRVKNNTFFISVGPMSEVIIDYMFQIAPDNQYVDVGSGLAEFIHGRKTRPYMIEGSAYSKKCCQMEIK
jgi:hypothetical protein